MKRIRVTVDFFLDVPSYGLDNLSIEADVKMFHSNMNAESPTPPIQIPAKLVHYQTQEIVEVD